MTKVLIKGRKILENGKSSRKTETKIQENSKKLYNHKMACFMILRLLYNIKKNDKMAVLRVYDFL